MPVFLGFCVFSASCEACTNRVKSVDLSKTPVDAHSMTTLADLAVGESGTIDDVLDERGADMKIRLLEMGFVPGTVVKVVKRAPFGDPLQFQLRGFHMSLRRSEASQVRVQQGVKPAQPTPVDVHCETIPPPNRAGRPLRVALAGNPNVGKTSLFNVLTGSRHETGNYPGVTVERRIGRITASLSRKLIELTDLPGTYSLTATAEDEEVAFRVLAGFDDDAPDAILLVLDASNLARNLYLALQIQEFGIPLIIALNMVDVAQSAGIVVDAQALSSVLGVPVIKTIARTGAGAQKLTQALEQLEAHPTPGERRIILPQPQSVLGKVLGSDHATGEPRWQLACAAAERPHGAAFAELAPSDCQAAAQELIELRYARVDASLAELGLADLVRDEAPSMSASMRVDAVLTHPVLGLLIFLLVMAVVFVSLFTGADPLIGLIEDAIGWLRTAVDITVVYIRQAFGMPLDQPPGLFVELLKDGVISGVGNVVVFVPQIALLFLFIGLLEDSGYLARAAFMLDRMMSGLGLHGRAFIPLLSGYACAIPAILGTRTISSRKDRLVTMLMIPYMSCSARLPIYTLIISSLFVFQSTSIDPNIGRGLILLSMYLLSTGSALVAGLIYKRTILISPTPPLVLELPPYRWPRWRNIATHVYARTKDFLTSAGTIILACTVVLWALLSFPRDATHAGTEGPTHIAESYGGRAARALEPALTPIGQDWRVGIGIIGSFAAREVLVGTMGLVYGMELEDDDAPELREAIRNDIDPQTGRHRYTSLTGLALMVFFVYACQCMSTVAVVRRETQTWTWPIFMFVSMTALAYIAALVVYQGGLALGFQ